MRQREHGPSADTEGGGARVDGILAVSTERTQIERAADWLSGLRAGDVPADVLALARAQRINILAGMFAGARTGAAQRAIAAIDALDPGGEIVTIPDGRPRSMLGAAYVSAACATALELDDFVFAGHTGQAAVTVPLIVGQALGASGEESLLAQVAANEIAGRLGAVMTAGPQHGHMKAYLNRAAAATAAARMLRLDPGQSAQALAIALSAPEYTLFPASFSPDTKAVATGDAIVAGVRAAYLARAGVDAALDVVEHSVGLVTSLSHHDVAPPVWDRLGSTWSIQAICFKPVCACAYACAAAVATAELIAGEGRDWEPGRVERVEVDTTVLTLTMEGFSRPHRTGLITPVNTNFSTRRTVALTMLAGTAPQGEHFLPGRFEELRPGIGAIAPRVELRHHWPYTIGLLRGVDAAIDRPGRPGIYGMVEAHRTLDRFREEFRTPAAVSWKDVRALYALPPRDRWYLARRYAVGLRSRLPFRGGAAARRAYVARETDLRRMSLRFSAAVRLTLTDGRTLRHEVITPPGFAGDPERLAIPEAKFRREVGRALSPGKASRLLGVLRQQPAAAPAELARAVSACTRPYGSSRVPTPEEQGRHP